MANYEVERRFLVAEPQILEGHAGYLIEQAYLWKNQSGYAIRVRRTQGIDDDGQVYESVSMFTLKGPKNADGRRLEEEVELSLDDAIAMMEGEPHIVQKTRFVIISENNTFEVDVFDGDNEGLVIAEFEASPEAVAKLKKPWWCGAEVTSDHRYNNENLAMAPWRSWPENQAD